MASLATKIELYVGRTVDLESEVRMRNDSDGRGDYIEEWLVDGIAKPTDDQLKALDSDGDVVEKNLADEYAKRKYQRDRKAEYPTIEELVVALYDTDDKAAIEKRRSDVKAKYPKP